MTARRSTSALSASRYFVAHSRSVAVQTKKNYVCALIGHDAFDEDDVAMVAELVVQLLREKLKRAP